MLATGLKPMRCHKTCGGVPIATRRSVVAALAGAAVLPHSSPLLAQAPAGIQCRRRALHAHGDR
jgi:hypothetical protein